MLFDGQSVGIDRYLVVGEPLGQDRLDIGIDAVYNLLCKRLRAERVVAVDVYELPYGIDLNVPYSAAVDVCQFASVSLEIRHNLVAHLFFGRAVWRNLRIHNED